MLCNSLVFVFLIPEISHFLKNSLYYLQVSFVGGGVIIKYVYMCSDEVGSFVLYSVVLSVELFKEFCCKCYVFYLWVKWSKLYFVLCLIILFIKCYAQCVTSLVRISHSSVHIKHIVWTIG